MAWRDRHDRKGFERKILSMFYTDSPCPRARPYRNCACMMASLIELGKLSQKLSLGGNVAHS